MKLKRKGYFPFANIKELEIFQKPFMIIWGKFLDGKLDIELQNDFILI